MGGVGFSELLLLALILLLAVGPHRLPEVARSVGRLTRQARGALNSLKSEFHEEMDRDHNRRILESESTRDEPDTAEQTPHERREDAD